MSAFSYVAVNSAGKKQKGVLEADSARQVRAQLREKKLVPLQVTLTADMGRKEKSSEKKAISFPKARTRIKIMELTLITRQLATLLSAGIPLDDAISHVAQQTQKIRVKSILLAVRSKLQEGHSLAASMQQFPNSFSKLYTTTLAAGEKTGKLDYILHKLADYLEKQHRLRQKVMQALLYPSVMTLVSIGIVIFLLTNVVPKIVTVFVQSKQVLPLSTVILLKISFVFTHYGLYLLALLILLIIGFRYGLKKESFRYRYHKVMLKLPVIGKAVLLINCARFARTLSILSAASVPMIEAMQAACALIVPLPVHRAVTEAIDHVKAGVSIHKALEKTGFFPPMLLYLVASGEASGQLDTMLAQAAVNIDLDVDNVLQNTLTLFEPLLILVMGGIVLFIVMAIMLPIFALDQLPGSMSS